MNSSAEAPVEAAVPKGRWRHRFEASRWEAAAGPRSRWSDVAAAVYAVAAMALLVGAARFGMRELGVVIFFVPWAAYAAGLAWATRRMRPRVGGGPAFRTTLALVLVHALAGASASLVFAADGLVARSGSPTDWAFLVALLGVLFGWIPGLVAAMCIARSRPYCGVLLAGVVWMAILWSW